MSVTEEMQTWPIDVRGRSYNVTLMRLENGRLAVRANGRAAAKPFAPEDEECSFKIEDTNCRLVRQRDGRFRLDVDEQSAPLIVPADAVPESRDLFFFGPRAIVWSLIALIVIVPFIWYLFHSTYSKVAARRVEHVLTGMSAPMDQSTIGLWVRDTRNLSDRDELSAASNGFDRWRLSKELPEQIGSWKIIDTESVKGTEVPTAIVKVDIDGRRLAMLVPERLPISWADDK